MSDAPRWKLLDQEERAAAYSGPAPIANRVFVHPTPLGMRIAFAEQQDSDTPIFRSAAVISYQDALDLSHLLVAMVEAAMKQTQQDQSGTAL